MEGLTKRTIVLLLCGFLFIVTLMSVVYYVFVSPTGWKAREDATLAQLASDDVVSYVALDGSPVDLKSFDGGILIVTVWASWSPYTKADLVQLHALKNQYGDRITIRAVNRKEPKETALAYLNTIGREEGIEYIIDETDHFYNALGGYAMPETFVFDRIGNISSHIRGALASGGLQAEIERLLTISE